MLQLRKLTKLNLNPPPTKPKAKAGVPEGTVQWEPTAGISQCAHVPGAAAQSPSIVAAASSPG